MLLGRVEEDEVNGDVRAFLGTLDGVFRDGTPEQRIRAVRRCVRRVVVDQKGAATVRIELCAVPSPQFDARVSVEVGKLNGEHERVRVRLVRSGTVVADIEGVTPLKLEHIDKGIRDGERLYYRVLGSQRTVVLVSNPIFVRGTARAGSGYGSDSQTRAMAREEL